MPPRHPPRRIAAATLARHLRTLATDPKDFNALIGAGNAALDLGDTQAAAGFFGRAEEVGPNNPLPQAGMGAAMVAQADAQGALAYFPRAEALKGSVLTFAADRGLAYDLLGRQADAQADYRLALTGTDMTRPAAAWRSASRSPARKPGRSRRSGR